eukprot:jgi/Galph1/702/GphlegSOOS_G5573.1
MGEFSSSDDYANFRAWVPKNVLSVGSLTPKNFLYYDWGPRRVPLEPLVCLHAAAGDAEVFFLQVLLELAHSSQLKLSEKILGLAPRGYRVVSVEIPPYFSVNDFCDDFHSFLDTLGFRKVHVFGAGLGGFLGQCYAAKYPDRVASIILLHSFSRTNSVKNSFSASPLVIPWLPEFMLQKLLLEKLPQGRVERRIGAAVKFIASKINNADYDKLTSRLILTISPYDLDYLSLQQYGEKVTIISTLDWLTSSGLSKQLYSETIEIFSRARRALLKDGGDFPYLSRADEVNIHLLVHMRRHASPPASPMPLPPPARSREPQPVFRVSKGSPRVFSSKVFPGSFPAETNASKVAKLKELLPDYNEQFLEAALLVYHGNIDEALQNILDGSIPKDMEQEKETNEKRETFGAVSDLGNNFDDYSAKTHLNAAELALDKGLLPPSKDSGRGLVERNPLEYERESSEGKETALGLSNDVYVPRDVFERGDNANAETFSAERASECFLGGEETTALPYESVSSLNVDLPQNTMQSAVSESTTEPAGFTSLESNLMSNILNVVRSPMEGNTYQSTEALTAKSVESTSKNGEDPDAIDHRLLEWKMSAYASPSLQKP